MRPRLASDRRSPRPTLLLTEDSTPYGGGSTTATPSAICRGHPSSCTRRWRGRHSETRFSSSVGPPSDQSTMWWPSVQAGGRSHPGKRQPWSRRFSAVRIGAGIVRVARPTERGVGFVIKVFQSDPSGAGATVTSVRTASQAMRRASQDGSAQIRATQQALQGRGCAPYPYSTCSNPASPRSP